MWPRVATGSGNLTRRERGKNGLITGSAGLAGKKKPDA